MVEQTSPPSLSDRTIMALLALFLAALTGDVTPAQQAQAQPPKPEVVLFSRSSVIGWEITDGLGLDKDLGAPGSLVDVVQAALLFPAPPPDKRTFATISVAAQQVQSAVERRASLVVALDHLLPMVYVDAGSDEQRRANVEAALKTFEAVQVPLLLGNVPDLKSASTILNPLVTPRMLPKPETVVAINERIAAWAKDRPNVVVVPLWGMYDKIDKGEPFAVRASAWPKSWLPELLQKDRLHPRLNGTIAAWLLAQDALCTARKDLDPNAFDWAAASIYRKVYNAKEAQRKAAREQLTDAMRLQPNRPVPPLPPPPPQIDQDEAIRRKARGEDPERPPPEPSEKDKKRGKGDKDGGEEGGG